MVEVRFIADHEVDDLVAADSYGFGVTPPADVAANTAAVLRETGAIHQAMAAFDGGSMVAAMAGYPLELTIPGGQRVPMAGTTWVSVQPTHRRRGIMRKMMTRHLEQAKEQGKVVAGLWSTQEPIYGRFGYGLAASYWPLQFDARRVRFRADVAASIDADDEIQLRTPAASEWPSILPPVYDASLGNRPGAIGRSAAWWRTKRLSDPSSTQAQQGELRAIVAGRRPQDHANRHPDPASGHRDHGYVLFRLNLDWNEPAIPSGRLSILEMAATDDPVRRHLWRAIMGFELHPNIEFPMAPVDEPLPHEITQSRLTPYRPVDGLWLRLLDIPAALAQRGYAGDGRVTLHVLDDLLDGGGRYQLSVSAGQAQCVPTNTVAVDEVTVTVADLGSLYLGAITPTQLHRANRLDGPATAIAALQHLLATPQPPYCPEDF